eukprot:scaffold3154_cov90-Skeletonema_marinoi.AAC.2
MKSNSEIRGLDMLKRVTMNKSALSRRKSTALVHLSDRSVVDGPSASTITSTSHSSNGGTRTTASEEDSSSQPNDGTQLSDQMQLLNIGRNSFIQSNQLSLPELRAYCQSDSLTEHGLRERLSHLNLQVEDSTYDILLVDVCANDCVTHEMVQCVIEHVPGAASAVNRRGATPLHVVCSNINVTRDIFRCVFEANPHALLAQDDFESNPLVYLCCNEALDETVAVEILTLILDECPESAKCCHDGFLPIHYAYWDQYSHSPDFCCMLIRAYPKSIQHEVEGEPMLFEVLFSCQVDDRVAFAVLKMLLEDHPRMVRDVRRSDNGMSILHGVAYNDLPRAAQVCRLIIQAFPELVLLGDSTAQQLQPLHIACNYGSLPVVECILDMYLPAIHGQSSDGKFPIHHAVFESFSDPQEAVEVVKYLLSVDPSVASQEVDGFYPLIFACAYTNSSGNLNACLEVIKLLYNAYPEAIVNAEALFWRGIDNSRSVNDFGDFLHQQRGIHGGRFVNAVRGFLYRQFRYAAQASDLQLVRTHDENGRLPLHHALRPRALIRRRGSFLWVGEEVAWGAIKLLVKADPSTLLIPDSDGSLPLNIACEHHDCPDVIKYLVDLNIDILLVADNRGNTPLHCACLAANYVVIEMFLTRYSTAAVCERNVDGDLPIQLLLDQNDQESADYASCIFLLLKASPEMWMSNEDLVLALTS